MAKKKIVSRSNEERIIRVWDIEQIKDLMSRRTVYETNGQREEELRDLWVQLPENQKTASFGRNWGYYVGMDEIKRYYVTQYNEQVQAEIAKLSDVDVPGTGRFLFHPLSTPNVNLAEDGKTAQGTWYSIGADCYPAENGKADCNWNCQKICADFIKEPRVRQAQTKEDTRDAILNVLAESRLGSMASPQLKSEVMREIGCSEGTYNRAYGELVKSHTIAKYQLNQKGGVRGWFTRLPYRSETDDKVTYI